MEFHKGRLVDHVHLIVDDLARSKRFYRAILEPLGHRIVEGEGYFNCDELWVSEGKGSSAHVHLAFQARDRETVDRFYKAGLEAGGKDNGGPGERDYHPGYYAAYLFDPDGNNIEAVIHGSATRSAESVVISPTMG